MQSCAASAAHSSNRRSRPRMKQGFARGLIKALRGLKKRRSHSKLLLFNSYSHILKWLLLLLPPLLSCRCLVWGSASIRRGLTCSMGSSLRPLSCLMPMIDYCWMWSMETSGCSSGVLLFFTTTPRLSLACYCSSSSRTPVLLLLLPHV